MTPLFLVYGALGLGVISAVEVNNNRVTLEKAQACIREMFTDPDAFDPSVHFEVKADEAPPFPDAIEWINSNLKECLE